MRTSVFVSLDNNPSRCIRNTKVENLASSNQCIESMHDFLNTSGKIPLCVTIWDFSLIKSALEKLPFSR